MAAVMIVTSIEHTTVPFATTGLPVTRPEVLKLPAQRR